MVFKKKSQPGENKRKSEIQSFQEAFSEMLNTYRLNQKYNESNIVARWEEITGKTIASRTSKIFIKDKKLFLEITSAPLRQQLLMSKTKLLEIINKDHPEPIVQEIKFL